MFVLSLLLGLLVSVPIILLLITAATSLVIGRRFPATGRFEVVDGVRLHAVSWPAEGDDVADRTPVLFIHGASGNLRDQSVPMLPYRGQFPMIFVDRPGHGWSERGKGHDRPDGQARAIAALLRQWAPGGAVVVGHSFGGAVALNLAMNHPEMVRGLVLLSPASHPWPGGATNWYYPLAARPLLGRLFVWMLALPGGLARIGSGITCVFAPNPVTDDYMRRAAIPLVFRPRSFRANAIDVNGLYDHVVATHRGYRAITCPTIVLTGDADTVVYEHIHSIGCARDIAGAALHVVRNCGHKSDHVAARAVVAAIAEVSGVAVPDVGTVAEEVAATERRIAGDREGPTCRLTKPEGAADMLAAATNR